MSHIQSFGRVVGSMVQSNPQIAGLVWGGAQLIIEMCVRPTQIHEMVFNMLETLSQYLPLFETWCRLFPEASYTELSDSICNTCLAFFSFVVHAIRFLRNSATENALRSIFCPSFQTEFAEAERKIKRQTKHLELQVQTAGLTSSQARHQIIRDMLQSSANSPPRQLFDREEELSVLHEKLANGRLDSTDPKLASVVLHGLGGFGKSTVALEYLYRHYDLYKVIIWLYADKKEKLDSQVVQLARLLGHSSEGGNTDDSREAVMHWITHLDVNYLIVFDNADDITLLNPYWPSSNHGSIIITSRNSYPGRGSLAMAGISIEPFTVDQGANYLLHLLTDIVSPTQEDKDAVRTIAENFDGFPLGLRQAAYFMRNRRCLPAAYLLLYSENRDTLEQEEIPGYSKTLADVWELSMRTLSQDAANLLDILTFLDPDAIPIDLFKDYGHTTQCSSFLEDALRYLNASELLLNQSLININVRDNIISMHRFFQAATFRKLGARRTRFHDVCCSVIQMINHVIPQDDYLSMKHLEAWRVVETYISHAEVLYERAGQGIPVAAVNNLLDFSGRISGYYYETGRYEPCGVILSKAKDLAANEPATDRKILSKIYYYHGRLCQETNKPDNAIQNFEKAIDHYESALLPDVVRHEDTYLAILYENLGMSCIGAEKYDDAEMYLDKAIELGQASGSATSSVLGDFLQCKGACFLWKGDLAKAEDILCRALLERCGENNENRGGALYSLGNVYFRQGRYSESLELHQQVLELYTTDLGNNHHWVADSCHKIGSILAVAGFDGGDLVEAERFLRRSLDIWDTPPNLGKSHSKPSAARSSWKLASILTRLDLDSEEGRLLHQKSCEYVMQERGVDLNKIDDPEAVVDSLVWYWSR
ncbi:uncharacterized protein BDZ99DRAFT_571917 [Mytilinidion resinicola]|uniref:TPR-like protein n=1 Tax=Mytilinidion resinicola TaxID=574789 RepID=A0A6A6YJV7_9PEZI|nr:uncharacterized protein BDZ99DRAFT_571917 [Mytilinidion resinicola]KAF2809091.1 hypothetical protein BDZ99DRAFT_571917 [Mytilinidion resinicola]